MCAIYCWKRRGRAPEQVHSELGARGPHNDVWGFAACILHLATGQLPYAGLTMIQMGTAMSEGRTPNIPDTLPEWLQQIMRDCVKFDATARPSVVQLQQVIVGMQNFKCWKQQAPSVPHILSAWL